MQNPFEIPLRELRSTIIALKPVLIHAMGVEGLVFIANNFRDQGYHGRSFIPWDIQKKPDKPRPHRILVLDKILIGSFTQTDTADASVIGTDTPYARVHNEGNRGQYGRSGMGTFGKPVNLNTPQRQFLPVTQDDSPVLLEKCQLVLIRKITDALPK